jgi:hypothetical protein
MKSAFAHNYRTLFVLTVFVFLLATLNSFGDIGTGGDGGGSCPNEGVKEDYCQTSMSAIKCITLLPGNCKGNSQEEPLRGKFFCTSKTNRKCTLAKDLFGDTIVDPCTEVIMCFPDPGGVLCIKDILNSAAYQYQGRKKDEKCDPNLP